MTEEKNAVSPMVWLTEWAGQAVASEMHGMMSGFSLSCIDEDTDVRIARLLDSFDGGEEVDDEDREQLAKISDWVGSSLRRQDLSFDFNLLLPDDEQPINQRLMGLGFWCQGFLFALGAAGQDAPWLDDEAVEVLSDIQKMSQVGSEADDEAEAEALLMEVVEYVRVAVMLLAAKVAASLTEDSE
ncbi:MAG TPA: hypothetical protein EYN26_02555 [Chromatiales bacterium]|jgi:uncharacterized protein YgfB (UPF0149 family)|nr:UPF0149 family protein [Chromatiaceae bacterium]HIB84444.1 UPF0149 family protein [Chromatiaceae bacterium]HIO14970.1 hypothetical protein [Chromatiales bacterium]HIO54007.1 hypothetical protein [Chromatiales bacterium]